MSCHVCVCPFIVFSLSRPRILLMCLSYSESVIVHSLCKIPQITSILFIFINADVTRQPTPWRHTVGPFGMSPWNNEEHQTMWPHCLTSRETRPHVICWDNVTWWHLGWWLVNTITWISVDIEVVNPFLLLHYEMTSPPSCQYLMNTYRLGARKALGGLVGFLWSQVCLNLTLFWTESVSTRPSLL